MFFGTPREDVGKSLKARAWIWVALLGLLCAPLAQAGVATGPPPTRVEVVRDTLHGVVIEDPYRWLEDQEAPETREWIEAQNEYSTSLLGEVKGREALEKRLEGA